MPKSPIPLQIALLIISATLISSRSDGSAPVSLGESDGLYYVKSDSFARQLRTEGGSPALLGEKTDIKILRANVYAEDNANTTFNVALATTDYPGDPDAVFHKSIALRIGDRCYGQYGGSGSTNGIYNWMSFKIHSQPEAEAAAAGLGVQCILRVPPGYKLLAQFVPQKPTYTTNEPVFVTFRLKNLDERTVIFRRGGHQRGPRDNQYSFVAMLSAAVVPDTGDPRNRGGLGVDVYLRQGDVFEDQVELTKWFTFSKPGTYSIHGSYLLPFFRVGLSPETGGSDDEMWDDYASGDFFVEVK
jgi:hypothetical protein